MRISLAGVSVAFGLLLASVACGSRAAGRYGIPGPGRFCHPICRRLDDISPTILPRAGSTTLVATDLDGGTSNVLFKTKPATKEAADKDARQEILSIQWKLGRLPDRLLIAVPE